MENLAAVARVRCVCVGEQRQWLEGRTYATKNTLATTGVADLPHQSSAEQAK